MKKNTTYHFYFGNFRLSNVLCCRSIATMLLFILGSTTGFSQPGNSFVAPITRYDLADTTTGFYDPEETYEETLVTLNVPRIGSLEIPAIVYGRKVYLSVKDVFDFLKIRNTPTETFDAVAGFFIDPKATYLIDKTNNILVL